MEDDEDMKAPQISDCIEVLSSDHGWNGTAVESEGALALLDKLFALLDPIKPMGTDDNKRIWIWADRGSADDSWDYEDMLASGEVKNRREFESLFLEFYPHETYWFPLQIMNYRGFRAVFLMYDCILVHDAREDCPSQARHPWHGEDRGMLGFLVKAAERSFRMIEEGTYNDYVQRNLPFRNRYGAIPSRIYHQVYPAVMENILDGLTAAEINEFRAIVERGDYESNRIGRMNKMTSGTYFAAVWNCYEAIGGRFRTGLAPKEAYHRFSFGYGDTLVALDETDPDAFERWYGERHDGHLWEIVPGRTYTRVFLYVCRDDDGWYFDVSGCHRLMETIRIFLTVRRLGYPVSIYEPEHLLDVCLERDRMMIVPDGIIPYGTGKLETGEYMFWKINADEKYLADPLLMANTEWFPLEFPELKQPIDD